MAKFKSTVSFEDIVEDAGVEMDPKGGLYFAKPYRNCASQAAFNAACRAAIRAKDNKIDELKDELSRKDAKINALLESKHDAEKLAIERGLEQTDLPPVLRERLMKVG